MAQRKSVKKNFIYNLIIQFLQVLSPLIITPYVSRILGAANIGIYSYVNANTAYFLLLAVLGMTTYAQLQGAKYRDNRKALSKLFSEVFWTRIITVFVSSLLFLCFISFQEQYKVYYYIQIINIFSCALDFIWLFQSVEDFKIVAIRTAIIKFLNVVLVFVLIKCKDDLMLYFVIQAIGVLLGNLSVLPLIKQYIEYIKPQRGFLKENLKSTSIYFLPTIAAVLTATVDKQMIGWFYSDKVESGYYEQAYYIENAVYTIFIALNYTMRPRMSYLYAKGLYVEIKDRMKKSLEFVLLLSIPLAFGVGILSKNYIPWFLGEHFGPVVDILHVMIAWIIVKAISNCLLDQNIVPNDGQLLATKIIWIGTIFNIIFNALLIPKFAAKGAAIGSALSETVILLITLWVSKESINIKKTCIRILYYFAIVIPMVVILIIGVRKLSPSILNTISMTIICGLVYFGMLLLTRNKLLKETLKVVYVHRKNKK